MAKIGSKLPPVFGKLVHQPSMSPLFAIVRCFLYLEEYGFYCIGSYLYKCFRFGVDGHRFLSLEGYTRAIGDSGHRYTHAVLGLLR